MAIFARMALLMAIIGILGVMSYSMSHWTREIGLGIALGADRLALLRMIIGGGTGLIAAGLVLGTTAALGLTRLIGTLLFVVTATRPVGFVVAGGTLTTAALAACLIPASRASRIDAAVALRSE